MSRTTIQEKTERLVRLSSSNFENEANLAARAACRLILTHDLQITPADAPTYEDGHADGYTDGHSDGHAAGYKAGHAAGLAAGKAAGKLQTGRTPTTIPTHKIRAKYESSCRQCGKILRVGERISWKPRAGTWCLRCKP